jgi:hypothetical protein
MTFPRFFRAINNAGHRFDEAAALGEPLSIRRKAGEETAFVALMPNRGRRPVPMGKKSADPLGRAARYRGVAATFGSDGARRVGGVIITPNSPGMAMDLDIEALKAKLAALKTEHRDLDEVIARLAARVPVDQLELQRLKKRKLLLKDQITKIESELLPDIIA